MAVTAEQLQNAEPRPCDYCGDERVLLRRTISGSGIAMYFWLCAECQGHARRQNQWISHEVIGEWVRRGRLESPEAVPIFTDYASTRTCTVCGRTGAEYHHWAPRSMAAEFGDDWALWPGDYLCKAHHDLWHEVVTPDMPGRGNQERGKAVREAAGANGHV